MMRIWQKIRHFQCDKKQFFFYETSNIVYRCLIRKITGSDITRQLHEQQRLFFFEQRFHIQTPIN